MVRFKSLCLRAVDDDWFEGPYRFQKNKIDGKTDLTDRDCLSGLEICCAGPRLVRDLFCGL